MQKSYLNVSASRQWLQGTTTSCSPINSALYGNFVPAFEHGLDYDKIEKGIKQRKKKILNVAA